MSSYQSVLDNYYIQQAKGEPYFKGPAFQRGHGLGGIFRAIMRVAKPIFRRAAPIVKAGAKAIAKDAIRAGADIANDALAGRPVGESIEDHSKEAIGRIIDRGSKRLASMVGSQSKRGRKSIKGSRRKRIRRGNADVFD